MGWSEFWRSTFGRDSHVRRTGFREERMEFFLLRFNRDRWSVGYYKSRISVDIATLHLADHCHRTHRGILDNYYLVFYAFYTSSLWMVLFCFQITRLRGHRFGWREGRFAGRLQ